MKAGTLAALLTATLIAAACHHDPGDTRSSGAPGPIMTSVGPVPGPAEGGQGGSNPFAADRSAGGEGNRLFNQFNCSGCHGDHGGGGMGPSLRDADWLYGSSDAQIFDSIAQGRAHGMPAWAHKLSTDQIWRLVTYIKLLRTANEPNPPVPS